MLPWCVHLQICTSIIPGGFLYKSLLLFFEHHAHHICVLPICTFSSPLYVSIWLKFWPSWVDWLLCLCPTFPLVRLGHKGSTSTIVTAGSSGCVPQTGWSQKLAFSREYLVNGQKAFFTHYTMNPQMLHIPQLSNHSSDMHVNACVPRERDP